MVLDTCGYSTPPQLHCVDFSRALQTAISTTVGGVPLECSMGPESDYDIPKAMIAVSGSDGGNGGNEGWRGLEGEVRGRYKGIQ